MKNDSRKLFDVAKAIPFKPGPIKPDEAKRRMEAATQQQLKLLYASPEYKKWAARREKEDRAQSVRSTLRRIFVSGTLIAAILGLLLRGITDPVPPQNAFVGSLDPTRSVLSAAPVQRRPAPLSPSSLMPSFLRLRAAAPRDTPSEAPASASKPEVSAQSERKAASSASAPSKETSVTKTVPSAAPRRAADRTASGPSASASSPPTPTPTPRPSQPSPSDSNGLGVEALTTVGKGRAAEPQRAVPEGCGAARGVGPLGPREGGRPAADPPREATATAPKGGAGKGTGKGPAQSKAAASSSGVAVEEAAPLEEPATRRQTASASVLSPSVPEAPAPAPADPSAASSGWFGKAKPAPAGDSKQPPAPPLPSPSPPPSQHQPRPDKKAASQPINQGRPTPTPMPAPSPQGSGLPPPSVDGAAAPRGPAPHKPLWGLMLGSWADPFVEWLMEDPLPEPASPHQRLVRGLKKVIVATLGSLTAFTLVGASLGLVATAAGAWTAAQGQRKARAAALDKEREEWRRRRRLNATESPPAALSPQRRSAPPRMAVVSSHGSPSTRGSPSPPPFAEAAAAEFDFGGPTLASPMSVQ